MFGFSTIRLIVYGVIAASLIAAFAWYHHSVYAAGEANVKAHVAQAIAQQQAIADKNAEFYQAQQAKTRIEYRTRVKEIVKNVPVNHSCDYSPAVVSMFNSAIDGVKPSR
jgi:hypothetical protein